MELAWRGCTDDEIASYSRHVPKTMIETYTSETKQIMRARQAREKRKSTERAQNMKVILCMIPRLVCFSQSLGEVVPGAVTKWTANHFELPIKIRLSKFGIPVSIPPTRILEKTFD
jgi:hypothetical protein